MIAAIEATILSGARRHKLCRLAYDPLLAATLILLDNSPLDADSPLPCLTLPAIRFTKRLRRSD